MPTYEYACTECGNQFDVVQSFSDDALTTCEHCGGSLRKVFGSVGIVFKGSGFYKNDSRGASSSTAASKGSATAEASGPKESADSSSSSSKNSDSSEGSKSADSSSAVAGTPASATSSSSD